MKTILSFLMFCLAALPCVATQSTAPDDSPEATVAPTYDATIVRKCEVLDVEGQVFQMATVEMKASSFMAETPHVTVTVTDAGGNKVYKKKMKHTYLYIFRTGQVQVGKPNFDKILISPAPDGKGYLGMIRELEGVF